METSPRAHDGEYPNPISKGLILWRFSSAGRSDLWCLVFEFPGALYLVIDDDPQGPRPYLIHERHPDIIGLLNRSEEVKGSLLRCGWTEVTVE